MTRRLLISFAFLLLAPSVYACMCEPRQTTLKKFQNADVVIIGKLTEIEKVKDPPKVRYGDDVRSATMVVQKVFKGDVKVNDKMQFGQGGGIRCDWTYHEGEIGTEYLLYLKHREKVEGFWYVWGCRTSLKIEVANDDLLFLNNMNRVRGQTRVSGFYASDLYGRDDFDLEVAHRKISIIGRNKTYTAITNENGVYELYGLPPGKYRLETPIPPGLMIDNNSYEYVSGVAAPESMPKNQMVFILRPKGHVAIDVLFKEDKGIRGRVFGPNGKPLFELSVDLLKAEDFSKSDSESTDWKGRFEFYSVTPGKYLIALNLEGKRTSDQPFPTLYYPNTATREKAEVLTITSNDLLRDLKIVIPVLDDTISVEGVVLEPNNYYPCHSLTLKFEPKKPFRDLALVDANASKAIYSDVRFTLTLLKGFSGDLFGEFLVYKDDFVNCPQVDELIEKNGGKAVSIRTRPIRINAQRNLRGLVLKFPYPHCRCKLATLTRM